MIDIKPELYNALCRALPGGSVFPVAPEAEAELPCISYMEINNAPTGFGDDAEYSSEVEVVVDVWGHTLAQITPIALSVDREMTAAGWLRTYATDIPPEGGVIHKNMRFSTSI